MTTDRDIPPQEEDYCEDCGTELLDGRTICKRCAADYRADENE